MRITFGIILAFAIPMCFLYGCGSDPASPSSTVTYPKLSYSATSLSENTANRGAVAATITVTLTQGKLATSQGTLTAGTHYTLDGTALPSGLTATLTANSETEAVLSLSGQATSHQAAHSVSGISLTFKAAAFSENTAPNDGSETTSLSLIFSDNQIVIYGTPASGGGPGGRTAVDTHCVTNKPGGVTLANVRAFVSTTSTDEIRDMPTNYDIPTSGVAIKSPNGTQIADDWADLIDDSWDTDLQSAGTATATTEWYSFSNSDGSLSSNHCGNATNAFLLGARGQTNSASTSLTGGGTGDPCLSGGMFLCLAYD